MSVLFNQFLAAARSDMEKYDFLDWNKRVTEFITNNLSAFYLDIAKDIVYIDKQDGHKRRSMQTVMYEMTVGLTKLLTPVLPHTTEEIWAS